MSPYAARVFAVLQAGKPLRMWDVMDKVELGEKTTQKALKELQALGHAELVRVPQYVGPVWQVVKA